MIASFSEDEIIIVTDRNNGFLPSPFSPSCRQSERDSVRQHSIIARNPRKATKYPLRRLDSSCCCRRDANQRRRPSPTNQPSMHPSIHPPIRHDVIGFPLTRRRRSTKDSGDTQPCSALDRESQHPVRPRDSVSGLSHCGHCSRLGTNRVRIPRPDPLSDSNRSKTG